MKMLGTFVLTVSILFVGCTTDFINPDSTTENLSSTSSLPESSTIIVEESIYGDDLLIQADIMTHHLMTYSFDSLVIEGNLPSKLAVNSFVLTVPLVQESDYMYKEFVTHAELYEYPKRNVEQIAFDVFGMDNWILEGGDTEYDETRSIYTSSLAFGIGHGFSCKDISSKISAEATTIASQFTLLDTDPNGPGPEWRENGKYQIVFSIMQDNNRRFLRFLRVEKV